MKRRVDTTMMQMALVPPFCMIASLVGGGIGVRVADGVGLVYVVAEMDVGYIVPVMVGVVVVVSVPVAGGETGSLG